MKKLLTLCVAAYNVEASIGDMIQSVADSGDAEKIELIIVNDGSKDATGEVVKKYIEEYPGLIVYIEKENGGSGSARNVGIRKATGTYFKILDGDDKVDSEGLHKLIQCLQGEPADLILTKMVTMLKDRVVGNTSWKQIPVGVVMELEKVPLEFAYQMHYMTIKTSILKDNGIVLSEGISYVDMEFIAYTLPYVKDVLFQDYTVYIYYTGLAMQSTTIENRFKKKKHLEKICINVALYYKTIFREKEITEERCRILEKILLGIYVCALELYLKDKKSIKDDYLSFDKAVCAVDSFVEVILEKHPYVTKVRRDNYRRYDIEHIYRIFKFQIYRWIKGE